MSRTTFDIYHASAGAGKTYQLVYNFLSICLSTPSPSIFRNILAITFTNKAAAEMKERIIRSLKSIESGDEPLLAQKLAEDLHITEGELRKRCSSVLRIILHQYSAFSVSTIDKFTNRLIRSFASDLKLSVNYEVELNEDLILQEAIDKMLSGLEEEKALADILIRFLNTQLEEGRTPRPENRLIEMGKSLFREEAFGAIYLINDIDPKRIIKIRQELYQRNKQIEEELKKKAKYLLTFIDEHGIGHNLFSGGYLPNYLKKVINSTSLETPGVTVKDQLNGDKAFYPKSKSKEGDIWIAPVEGQLTDMGQDLIRYISTHYFTYHMSAAILRSIFEMAVLSEIEKNLEEIKSDSNRLPIGEFNKLISEKLRDQPSAFLYERIGDRYQHYFIDEFQDTSKLQWKNIVPLINNAMAQGGSAMLVGDAKQSIYRWRGGDVNQFLSLSYDREGSNEVVVNDRSQKLYERNSIAMPDNYRSKSNIVEFNNLFFNTIVNVIGSKGEMKVTNDMHRDLFLQSGQGVKAGTGGYIDIELVEYESEDQYVKIQCERCESIIREALKQAYALKDIAILTRGNKQARTLSEYLINKDIPVVSPDSLTLEQSREVRGLVSFLHFLYRPDDLRIRVDFLDLLWENTDQVSSLYFQKHLFYREWTRATPAELFKKLEDLGMGFSAPSFLALPLTEKIYQLMDIFKLDPNADPFLQAFIDEVVNYELNIAEGESGFMRWWEAKGIKAKVDLPDEVDAVRLMTIHKAKGLEFPLAILAFADWKAFQEMESVAWMSLPQEDFFGLPVARINLSSMEEWPGTEAYQEVYWQNKEDILLDNLNLLYVALTRASEQMYILGASGWQDSQRVTTYLQFFLDQQGTDLLHWSFGEKENRKETPLKMPDNNTLMYKRTNWHRRLSITSDAPLDWEAGEPDHTAWGKKIHGILADIDYPENMDEVLMRASEEGRIISSEKDVLHELIDRVLKNPELEKYFSRDGKVINESEILLPRGKSMRPDRLLLHGRSIHVIDYKTGVRDVKHRLQVDEYASVLHEMGFEIGDKVLIYLGEETEVVKW